MAVVAIIICFCVILGFLAVFVGIVSLLSGRRRSGRSGFKAKHAILNPVRERFGAENLRPNRLGELNVFRPALVFDYGRTMARLKHFGKPFSHASQKTVLETSFDLPPGQDVTIVSRDGAAGKEPAASFLETGDEEFDQKFYVYTNEPSVAKQLLTDAVKWKMSELKNLNPSELKIQLEGGLLKTSSRQWFGTGQELLDFVQGSLELFDQLMLHKAEGVEFLHQNQAAIIEDFRCPICSDDVMHEMVVCRRCKTPHCAECWEYNGKCATFACMEERYLRVEEQEL